MSQSFLGRLGGNLRDLWKYSGMRFKIGLFMTFFFLILGFGVSNIPHTNPFFHFSYLPLQPPSSTNFLGTTSLGQDTFWMLVNAVRNSLTLGLIAATIGTVIGIFFGLLAGFSGGVGFRIYKFNLGASVMQYQKGVLAFQVSVSSSLSSFLR